MRLRLAPARRRRASERAACVQLAELAGPCCPEPLRPASLLAPCPCASSCSPWPAALQRGCAADEEQTARRDSSAGSPLERSSVARAPRACRARCIRAPLASPRNARRPSASPAAAAALAAHLAAFPTLGHSPRQAAAACWVRMRRSWANCNKTKCAPEAAAAGEGKERKGAAPAAHVTQSPAWSVRENWTLEGARRLHKAAQGSGS
jgi:hypothetical protein